MSFDINLISAWSILAPIIVGAIGYRAFSFNIRFLFLFICLTGVLELISGILMHYQMNNLLLFHIHVYLEFIFITLIFFFVYDSVLWRAVSLIFLGIFLVYSIINNVFYEGLEIFNSRQRYVEGLMLIVMCAGYFISLMRRPIHRYLEKQPMFWLVSGWLIYFAGTLYLFLFSNELMAEEKFQFWEVHSVLNIGLNTIYVVAFLKERKL